MSNEQMPEIIDSSSSLVQKVRERFERNKVKRRLKAALRRKPRPAKVKIDDADVPVLPEKKGW